MVLVVIVVAIIVALAFDVINGFHDSANSIATVVSTRVLSPRTAVLWAAFFNFIAMFVFPAKVADTISKIVVIDKHEPLFVYVVLSGLIGAIVWDLLTWWWGIPVSSSHALVGGVVGAGLAFKGLAIIHWDKVWSTVVFIPLAPLIGFVLGFVAMVLVMLLLWRCNAGKVDRFFRRGQLVSASLYSLGHGGNDAQKTMGIIVALMVAGGYLDTKTKLTMGNWRTVWIILACHLAMAIGTALGGWRIVRTMGARITQLKPVGGFCAETAGAITIFMATYMGVPVSTTHTITGAIVGVGSTKRLSAVRWGVATRIVWSWIFTIPIAAIIGAVVFEVCRLVVGSH